MTHAISCSALGISSVVASGFGKLEEKKKRISRQRQAVKSLFSKKTATTSEYAAKRNQHDWLNLPTKCCIGQNLLISSLCLSATGI